MVGGLKGRNLTLDNHYGAILNQYAINSKDASIKIMEEKTLEIINAIHTSYDSNIKPLIFVALEAHAQGGGLASFLQGTKIPNCCVFSYNRQSYGDKNQRFINGAGFYESRIFWYQGEEPLFNINKLPNSNINNNEWYYISRMQHLSFEIDNNLLHDDYIEAICDLCNLWIADNNRDIFYKRYMEWRKKQ